MDVRAAASGLKSGWRLQMSELSECCAAMTRVALAIEAQTEAITAQAIAIGELMAYLSDSEGGDSDSPVVSYLSGRPK